MTQVVLILSVSDHDGSGSLYFLKMLSQADCGVELLIFLAGCGQRRRKEVQSEVSLIVWF